MRSFYRVIHCLPYKANAVATIRLEVRTHVQKNFVKYCDHFTAEIRWLLTQSPEFFVAANLNALSALQK